MKREIENRQLKTFSLSIFNENEGVNLREFLFFCNIIK
jgi:hypothetical protein